MHARRWRERLAALALGAGMTITPATAAEPLRYLALGDSYTVGEGVAAGERWTHQLAAALRKADIALADPVTIATTGWTTDELDAAIDAADPAHDYAFVTLLVGVNNQYRGRAVDEYAQQFEALLLRAVAFAGGRSQRVLVLSFPDWGVTAFGRTSGRDLRQVARETDAYNAAARAVCARHGVAFVDITPASRDGGDAPDMLAEDGLHPSATMYARWAQQALTVAAAQLAGAID